MVSSMADIIARVTLYPTSKGGRQGPTPDDMFGCIFEFEGEFFECRLLLGKTGPLSPGTEALVPVKFLNPNLFISRLQRGARFKLRELGTIGEGEVVDLLFSS